VQNATTRLIIGTRRHDHIMPVTHPRACQVQSGVSGSPVAVRVGASSSTWQMIDASCPTAYVAFCGPLTFQLACCRKHSAVTADWLTEQDLTSHQTHYRWYRGRFLQVIWRNEQCQSTEGN